MESPTALTMILNAWEDRDMPRRLVTIATSLVAVVVGLSACGGSDSAPGAETGSATSSGGGIKVVASFYPLAYAAERVGGDKVTVVNLTKPGAEPHDLELTPQDVATIGEAGLAVYEKGLQPAVDDAIASQGGAAFDVATVADLSLRFTDPIGGDAAGHGAESHDGHVDEEEGHSHEGEAGVVDPHFWLDPIRYQKVAQAISTELGRVDPINKGLYYENATKFSKELTTLDGDFASALTTCKNKKLVTSHAAFAYLADRYGLTQVAISGLSPDAEPDPARLALIADYVKKNKIGTIYTETLVSPAIGQTIAKETGAKTAVLDPIEGLSKESAGTDYLQVMRANLATLTTGQECA